MDIIRSIMHSPWRRRTLLAGVGLLVALSDVLVSGRPLFDYSDFTGRSLLILLTALAVGAGMGIVIWLWAVLYISFSDPQGRPFMENARYYLTQSLGGSGVLDGVIPCSALFVCVVLIVGPGSVAEVV